MGLFAYMEDIVKQLLIALLVQSVKSKVPHIHSVFRSLPLIAFQNLVHAEELA